jgi:hypothetical protein
MERSILFGHTFPTLTTYHTYLMPKPCGAGAIKNPKKLFHGNL